MRSCFLTGPFLALLFAFAGQSAQHTPLALRQSYSYDALNRLTEFSETVQAGGTGTWSEANQYDRYGNRWATSTIAQAATTPTQQGWISTATNRLVQSLAGGLTYDATGNLTAHPQVSNGALMSYDAENRLTGFGAGATYTYDGEGRRVKRTVDGTVTYYVYDGTGALAAEYGGGSPAVGRRYVTVDHLGSTRVTTDGEGTVRSRCDYLPFGDQILAISSQGNRNLIPEYACAGSDVTVKFTGKERDAETGLDYFGARYMSAAQGRFTSPDEWQGGPVDPFTGQQVQQPGPLPYADIRNPQSLNKYAYVMNNPLRYTDPDGHCVWDLCIGEGAAVYALGAAAAGATALYLASPQGQESMKAAGTLLTMAGQAITTAFNQSSDNSGNTPPPPPPTTGAQQQQQSTTATPPPPPGSGNQGDDRSGGGKTGRKQNADRAQSAQDKLTQAKENLANLNKQNPRPEGFQKALQQAKDQVKHWAKKAAEKSEEHARVNQR